MLKGKRVAQKISGFEVAQLRLLQWQQLGKPRRSHGGCWGNDYIYLLEHGFGGAPLCLQFAARANVIGRADAGAIADASQGMRIVKLRHFRDHFLVILVDFRIKDGASSRDLKWEIANFSNQPCNDGQRFVHTRLDVCLKIVVETFPWDSNLQRGDTLAERG